MPVLETDEERAEYEFNEADGWVSIGELGERRVALKETALGMLRGSGRQQIAISVSERDLARLKQKASEKGVHYRTLIDTILHDYAEE
ncbi:DNA-binding protein [Jiella endophytica]|uniref:DNA-binding protein n=1 Tax=Jiella endophytica TaxID=2558362 RepID=A0A4Y8R9Y3_9HYPH|nr:DNA-binding protein [Jiella endophytica]